MANFDSTNMKIFNSDNDEDIENFFFHERYKILASINNYSNSQEYEFKKVTIESEHDEVNYEIIKVKRDYSKEIEELLHQIKEENR